MFITKETRKSEIIEKERYKNKAIQLSLMQRNKLINEQNQGKADRVVQIDPTKVKREVGNAYGVVESDATNFEQEEKMDASSDESELNPIVTNKPILVVFN